MIKTCDEIKCTEGSIKESLSIPTVTAFIEKGKPYKMEDVVKGSRWEKFKRFAKRLIVKGKKIMACEGELKSIYSGLTTNVTIAQARSYKIWDRRRITVACHQVPDPAKTITGLVTVYGSIVDEDAWYVSLGTITINTAAELSEYLNVINSTASGTALIYLKFVVSNLLNGKIDIKIFESEW